MAARASLALGLLTALIFAAPAMAQLPESISVVASGTEYAGSAPVSHAIPMQIGAEGARFYLFKGKPKRPKGGG